MKTQTDYILRVFLGIALLGSTIPISALILNGCSTANRSAYVAEVATHTSVKVAMSLWDAYVKSGKATVAQEQQVKAAYDKVRLAAIALADAGQIMAAASSTNGGINFTAALSQGATEYTQAQADLIALLKGLGLPVK